MRLWHHTKVINWDIPSIDNGTSSSVVHEVKKRSPQVITTVAKKIVTGVGRTLFKAGKGIGTILPPITTLPGITVKTVGAGLKALSKGLFGLVGFLTWCTSPPRFTHVVNYNMDNLCLQCHRVVINLDVLRPWKRLVLCLPGLYVSSQNMLSRGGPWWIKYRDRL